MIIRLLILITLVFQLVSCNNKKLEKFNISNEDRKIIVGSIPEKLIHYGPARDNKIYTDSNGVISTAEIIKATVVFDSEAIKDYHGSEFSVSLFLKYHKNDRKKITFSNQEIISIEKSSLYKKSRPYTLTVGSKDSFIGENQLDITLFESESANSQEYIEFNDEQTALFRQKYSPKVSIHGGIYQYSTSIDKNVAALYVIKFHSYGSFSHENFLYSKKYIESLYYKK